MAPTDSPRYWRITSSMVDSPRLRSISSVIWSPAGRGLISISLGPVAVYLSSTCAMPRSKPTAMVAATAACSSSSRIGAGSAVGKLCPSSMNRLPPPDQLVGHPEHANRSGLGQNLHADLEADQAFLDEHLGMPGLTPAVRRFGPHRRETVDHLGHGRAPDDMGPACLVGRLHHARAVRSPRRPAPPPRPWSRRGMPGWVRRVRPSAAAGRPCCGRSGRRPDPGRAGRAGGPPRRSEPPRTRRPRARRRAVVSRRPPSPPPAAAPARWVWQ